MKVLCIYVFVVNSVCFQLQVKSIDLSHLQSTVFGYRSSNTFRKYFGISWMGCVDKCRRIRKCQSVQYIRMLGLCELNDEDEIGKDSQIPSRINYGAIFSSKSKWDCQEPQECSACLKGDLCLTDRTQKCKTVGCSVPNPIAGGEILGNLFHVGARRLYKCGDGKQQSVICKDDGTWFTINITCFCEPPEVNHANYQITESESGLIEANISCDPGYVKLGLRNLQCNKTSKQWVNLDRVDCVKSNVESWVLIFGKIQGVSGNIWQLWNNERLTNGDFRKDEVLANWSDFKIKQIKVEVIDFSDRVVATLLFNGSGTGNDTWFLQENLIESSWADLQAGVSVDSFKIKGLGAEVLGANKTVLRWTILNFDKTISGHRVINCSNNLVWLAVIHSKIYPCENLEEIGGISYHVIVFSNSSTGTPWVGGELQFAKKMLVYVIS